MNMKGMTVVIVRCERTMGCLDPGSAACSSSSSGEWSELRCNHNDDENDGDQSRQRHELRVANGVRQRNTPKTWEASISLATD